MVVAKDKKVRTFFGQRSYFYDIHDKDGNVISSMTPDEWKQSIIDAWTSVDCSWLAMIFHDRDVLPDGNMKPLHAHILINFKNARSFSSVSKLLGITREQNLQKCKSIADSARYLTHISETAINEGKTFYSPSAVIVSGSDVKEYSDLIKRGKGKSVVREEVDESKKLTADDKLLIDYEWSKLSAKVQCGEMTKKEVKAHLLDVFGETKGQMAWLSKRSGFEEDFKEYMEAMHEYYSINARMLDTFYISGDGGVGKTQLATAISKKLCDSLGVHKVAVPGKSTTFDFAGGYKGEKVTVANDLSTSSFHCRQFCNIFDPYEYSPINSRNYDKAWFARYCIITNSVMIEDFITNLIYFSGIEYQKVSLNNNKIALNNKESTQNMVIQVRRRFKYNIRIDIDASNQKYVELQKLRDDFSGFDTVEVIGYRNIKKEKERIADRIISVLGL